MGLCPRCMLNLVLDVRRKMQTEMGRLQPWPEAPTPEEITAALPQFEVMELLARGGMGLVYRARQKSLDRSVALKILPIAPAADQPVELEARFLAEARTLAGLNHPNIVMAIEAGQTAKWLYLVMELVHGPNLREVLRRQVKLDPYYALLIAEEVAKALAYAHARQVVHRDVKPENILLDPGSGAAEMDMERLFAGGGRARLADFGIARSIERQDGALTLTAPHHYVGTADYVAPECRQAGHAPTPVSDIYALGVVLYEMLTGRLPAGHFPPPSRMAKVPKRVDAIVLRCLAAEAEQRYGSSEELQRDLARARARMLSPKTAAISLATVGVVALVTAGVGMVLLNRPAVSPPVQTAGPETPASQPAIFALMPGDAVRVLVGDQWHSATVVQREGRRVLVHYEAQAGMDDEWVGADRLSW